MAKEPKRVVEIRLLALLMVDVRHPDLVTALRDAGLTPSVTDVVAAELSSGLESVSYVESAVVCRL